jgi:uncharacterized protein (TIGR02271 family)
MHPSGIIVVTGPEDFRGTIDTTAWPLDGSRAKVLIQLDSGGQVLVPRGALVRQDDGRYGLALDPAALERRSSASGEPGGQPLVLPVIQEALDVQTRTVETGRVRIHKMVHEREEIVDPPLWRDEVVIERVPINRVVEGPLSARSEGETLIIPLLEEVLVVETRLLLKEEVRISKQRVEIHRPQRVTLRREEAAVERLTQEDDEHNLNPEEQHDGQDSHGLL